MHMYVAKPPQMSTLSANNEHCVFDQHACCGPGQKGDAGLFKGAKHNATAERKGERMSDGAVSDGWACSMSSVTATWRPTMCARDDHGCKQSTHV
eukprot:CAMPEP_0174338352 /NCGR_PEP_ID=MMETSP0810-20121108/23069_1 /TAXON_ID=73025 ORGANISM="Eutreptiella gymnastica-like, Strain CCMP1594" /NCGR_SAMPLE_ID=MMETSP0810 /ASSEMBLY_ACC=CAM_ASM_000659 /LENGTH=94 /DNA_ID=CAMNT_0015458389 /DNA_START=86 /DNA_END=370 /DNA_ORIENTATION=+